MLHIARPQWLGPLLLALTMLEATPSNAQPVVAAFASPTGYGIESSAGSGLPYYGFTNPTQNNWQIAQWNNPESLPAFTQIPSPMSGVPTFRSKNGSATVTVALNQRPSATLSQNGVSLPCNDVHGSPVEFDLFVGGSTHTATASEQPAFIGVTDPMMVPNLTLSNMAKLLENGSLQLTQASQVMSVPGCPVVQGTALISLVFNDTAVTPTQTLFYKILLSRYCFAGEGATCSHPPQNYFYDQGEPTSFNPNGSVKSVEYGYNDTLTAFGIPFIVASQKLTLNLDVLPHLLATLAAGASIGIDQNPDHWVMANGYVGQAIWGNMIWSTSWSGFNPKIVTN